MAFFKFHLLFFSSLQGISIACYADLPDSAMAEASACRLCPSVHPSVTQRLWISQSIFTVNSMKNTSFRVLRIFRNSNRVILIPDQGC